MNKLLLLTLSLISYSQITEAKGKNSWFLWEYMGEEPRMECLSKKQYNAEIMNFYSRKPTADDYAVGFTSKASCEEKLYKEMDIKLTNTYGEDYGD